MTRVAIVLAGGDPVKPELRTLLPGDADDVIAADSGLHQAALLGVHVDVLVGDLDSADPAAVEVAVAAGTVVERHPVEKDATDFELALDTAVARGASRIVVVGGAGGRHDHLLANTAVLTSTRYATVTIDAFVANAHISVLHGGRAALELTGTPGSIVTLLPAAGGACGITTTGLQYRLDHEDLPAGTSRGVSNVLVHSLATVTLTAGTLLVIQPAGGVA